MASFGTIQFTGFANNTLPEVETSPLGMRVTIKPNDSGVEACYGTFAFAISVAAVAPGATVLSFVNRNSDILIRPKKIQMAYALGAVGSVVGTVTSLYMIRNVESQYVSGVDTLTANLIPAALRSGKFRSGQISSVDVTAFTGVQPLITGLTAGLSGGSNTQDTFPIAAIVTTVTGVAGTKVPPFALWDTAMGDDIIELQDGSGIVVSTASASANQTASLTIVFDQVDPKLL